ncbi:hypothetical protein RV11_GL000577 [Enterococcus phoeniculicola]|uniref:Uncharacterized protein n=1 Tax=Enterococcus phoeniculicola ATCC BAA-412 TaxID=1158610 RepID=R3WWZ7_9ENTE|nr:hypothetical protein [Enterococcus phoeniculicola]EOL46300.1 hypothetical protein UC3_01106 [Enterococcus phoeniculicola ATCC BAA-412]EOT76855.1 hypothetical protein I589_01816 [Enterococcus phoeniculicola ATCC BAA-412]OJG71287.1 hypothetical protein RV11_GL000577 [Enterococcus phoeniculicola]
MFTADMFDPVVTAITAVVPIGIGVGASILAVTWVGKKGFTFIKSMMNKG